MSKRGLRWSSWPVSYSVLIQIAGRFRCGSRTRLRRVYRQAIRSRSRGVDARRVVANAKVARAMPSATRRAFAMKMRVAAQLPTENSALTLPWFEKKYVVRVVDRP
jgi:hypothetical protein